MVNLADFGGPQFKPNEPGPGGHGQQGTLFSNRRLNAANRTGDEVGHKGFSPNRLNAVRSAVDVTLKASGMTLPITRALTGAHDAAWDRGEYPDSAEQLTRRRDIAVGMTTQAVHETIARSTVPESTLMRHVPGTLSARGTDITIDHLKGQAGTYSPMGGNITIAPDQIDTVVPVHELGHQQDWHAQAISNRAAAHRTGGLDTNAEPGGRSGAAVVQLAGQKTPVNMAKVEGFADAFADVHARPHPAQAKRDKASPYPDDPGGPYSRWREQDWAAYAGEDPEDIPKGSPSAAQAYRQTRKQHGGYDIVGAGHNFQQLQFGRHAEPDPGDETWDRALSGR